MNSLRDETDILFMTPPCPLEDRYGDLSDAGNLTPSLGILILAAVVREKGYRVSVLDASAENLSLDETLERVERLRPRTVGFSATTLSILGAEKLAEALKHRRPDMTTLVGGPHATAVPQETLTRCPHLDIAVLGEAENTIVGLLEALATGDDLSKLQGVAYRNEQGAVVQTPRRDGVTDLDALPHPAWDLLPGFPDRYNPPYFKVQRLPSTSLVTSRGCPYQCVFCDTSVFGAKVRGYSAEYLVDMLHRLTTDYGIRDITFEDDTFMFLPQRLRAVCEALIRSDLRLSWACNSRVDLAKPDLLRLMRRAGCWYISFGIESGSQEILDGIGKRLTLSQAEEAVRESRRAGVRAKGFFIVGHPGETLETLEQTRSLMLRLPLSDASVMCMTPFPGSPLSKNADRYGELDRDWSSMNLLQPAFVPFGLSKEVLKAWQSRLMREFYLRPRVWVDYAGRVLRHPSPAYVWGAARSAMALIRSGRR